jgi:DNA invertase Pin-like site-specific DNA recombinase
MATAIYARVSTKDQTTDNQVEQLKQVAAKAGWSVSAVYADVISGSKGREQRPELDAMLKAVTRREIDRVMVWSVDRLGRSLQDLVSTMQEIQAAGADLYLHQQSIDTSTPAGKALFQMCGVFAEFEREMIRERVKAGLERTKAKGTKLGRRPIAPIMVRKVKQMKQDDPSLSVRKIAKTMQLSPTSVQNILAVQPV